MIFLCQLQISRAKILLFVFKVTMEEKLKEQSGMIRGILMVEELICHRGLRFIQGHL